MPEMPDAWGLGAQTPMKNASRLGGRRYERMVGNPVVTEMGKSSQPIGQDHGDGRYS